MCISNKLHDDTQKSAQIQKHAAIITKNSKRPVASRNNTNRSTYYLTDKSVLTCSMHAEIAVLRVILKRVLKSSNKRPCVLRRS